MKFNRFGLACLVFAFGSFTTVAACRDGRPPPAAIDSAKATGGRAATGGRGGRTGSGGAGGSATMAPAAAPAAMNPADVAVSDLADALVSSDGSSDGSDAASDVRVSVDASSDGRMGVAPPDAGRAGPAACHPNPRVIAICHQLESACANCPGGPMGRNALDCYAAVQRRDDAACAKFAVDRKCPIDPGGNVCGSLNCGVGNGPPVANACNRTACRTAQGNGVSTACMAFMTACPCR